MELVAKIVSVGIAGVGFAFAWMFAYTHITLHAPKWLEWSRPSITVGVFGALMGIAMGLVQSGWIR